MKYSIRDTNLLAVERVLRSRDSLMSIAMDNFELKRSELDMKLSSTENVIQDLAIINIELEIAKKVVEQPVAKEYISLGLLKDVEGGIKHIKEIYSSRTEEQEKLQLLGMLKSLYGISREKALEHIDTLFSRDIDTITEELQLLVINIWTWKIYYSCLLYLRRNSADLMLTEQGNIPLQPEDNELKIKWLGTQKNLAELFIELHAKGFIENPNAKAIKRAFTQSSTIEQVLKPITSKSKSGYSTPTYDNVYTKNYSPSFDGIKPLIQKGSKISK